MAKSARQCALEALSKVNDASGYSNITIDAVLKKNNLDKRDSNLASALFYGTLERKITLDHCINAFSKKPVDKLTPKVRDILRMSLYQIIYMDGIPDNAAVNEGVNLTKISGVSSASGFVNAVLRNFIRAGGEIPNINGNIEEILSVKYSCNQWLCKKLAEQYGIAKAEQILSTSADAPPVFIRVNNIKINDDELIEKLKNYEITAEKTSLSHCIKVEKAGNITETKEFQNGLFHVQDMSSQICAKILDPQKGDRIADVCAAPGGKTFTICEIMEDSGEIMSMDLHENRTRLIKSGAERLGLKSIKTKASDASVYDKSLGEFDRILCDVPCSGFGIMRRKPEIKYKSEEDIKKLPEIQYKILENAEKYLKAGGVMVYSTCTVLKEENECVVKKFLDNHKEFEAYDENYIKTFIPQKDGSDGFFICKMRKVK